jgi:hypothetical protein
MKKIAMKSTCDVEERERKLREENSAENETLENSKFGF